jgi:fatty acid desaturase
MTPSSAADIVRAHRLVRDLFTPAPWRYWLELALTGTAAWAALLLAAAADRPLVIAFAAVVAVPLWYRAAGMAHELTHQSRRDLPGFHLAWNLAVGVAWLLPSVMYEGAHHDHHRKTTYGTRDDPEYLPLAGRPWAVARYLAFAFVAGPALLARFLVLAPVSWAVPPLRRFLIRTGSTYVINLAYARRMSPAERRALVAWECAVLLAWWPPVALTLAGELPWRWLAVWYGVYTGVLLVNRVRMLSAHHFALDGPTDHLGQFRDSLDTPAGWWAELWAPLGFRYHALHHLFPKLPFHNMSAAYRRLTAGLPPESFYHEATGRGLIPSVRQVLAGPRT